MPSITRSTLRLPAFMALALLPLALDSCSSTGKIEGIPENLPDIPLKGSTATPPHTMQSFEYPFDSAGNYVSEWAAEGEKRSGRPAAYSSDDEKKWSGSHGGSVTASRRSPKSKSRSVSYKVKSGDTLSEISDKFGISVSAIKRANGMKSNVVKRGEILKIPK